MKLGPINNLNGPEAKELLFFGVSRLKGLKYGMLCNLICPKSKVRTS